MNNMEASQGEFFQDMTNKMVNAGQKMTENYLENIPIYLHYYKDVSSHFMAMSSRMASNVNEVYKAQNAFFNYFNAQQELWKRTFYQQLGEKVDSVIDPGGNDKRFRASEWNEIPYFNFIKQNYLLTSQLMLNVVNSVDLDSDVKKKLNFYTQQFIDAMSPANFAATNPEVIKLAQETNGESLMEGFMNFISDMEKGRITQTDEKAFEVGVNLAITPGAVVFENELIQLIQYSPSTEKVHQIPLLIIPPWINKYYILDLRPENSYIKYIVDQGFTVFVISWRNPSPELGYLRFDDYISLGSIKAIETVRAITGVEKINLLGYCLGGTLIGTTLAILRKKEIDIVESATFLAAMLDFTDIGALDVVIDELLVTKLERDLEQGTVLKGGDMATAFNVVRANDLIWNYVINNYLKGKKPSSFDVLYWTNDNTNLPAKMYSYYLRNMVHENKLRKKNELVMCDTPIDLSKIDIPVYVVGTLEDHISPCSSNFITTELVSGPSEFVLGDSGHVLGIINPTAKKKYGHYRNGQLGKGFETWKNTAEYYQESWWVAWINWLNQHSGPQVDPPAQLGSKDFPVIEPAPGRYVKQSI